MQKDFDNATSEENEISENTVNNTETNDSMSDIVDPYKETTTNTDNDDKDDVIFNDNISIVSNDFSRNGYWKEIGVTANIEASRYCNITPRYFSS